LKFDLSVRDVVENSEQSAVYDTEAGGCIECQACTRVCPTCHCFYLYDDKQKDYFTKMKIWDSCMRFGYAAVAGGANPNKVLGERMKHRLMHKFVNFLDRYGVNMCVGCGRCVDADAGGMDLREILKKLSEETKDKDKKRTKVTK
jgi:ferredoxin